MNLGAAMAAGGVAIRGLNDFRRQAATDEYAKSLRDLALEEGKQKLAQLQDQSAESRRLRTKQEIFDKTQMEIDAAVGSQLFGGQPGASAAPGGVPGVTGADVAVPPPATMQLPQPNGEPPAYPPMPDQGGAPPVNIAPGVAGTPSSGPPIAARGVAPAAPVAAPGVPAGAGVAFPPGAGGMTPSVGPTRKQPTPIAGGPGPMSPVAAFETAYRIAVKNQSPEHMQQAIQGMADSARLNYADALKGAAAALAGGDARPMVQLYNQRYPNGHRVADIKPLPDGGVVVSEYDPRPGPRPLIERTMTPDQAQAQMVAMLDPKTWLDMAKERAKQVAETAKELAKEQVIGKREIALEGVKAPNEMARTKVTAAATVQAAGIHAGATIKAATIGADSREAVAQIKGALAEKVRNDPRASRASDEVYKILKSGPLGEMTGENSELAKAGAASLAADYATGESPMNPAAAAQRAVRETEAAVKAGKMRVPMPGAAKPGPGPAAPAVNTQRFGY